MTPEQRQQFRREMEAIQQGRMEQLRKRMAALPVAERLAFRERWLRMSPQDRREYLEREFPNAGNGNNDERSESNENMTDRPPRLFDNNRGTVRPPISRPIQRPVQRPVPGR